MIALSPRFTFLAALSTLAALSSFHVSDAAVLRSRDFVFPWIKVPGIDGGTLVTKKPPRFLARDHKYAQEYDSSPVIPLPKYSGASQKGKTVSGDSSERGEDDGKHPSDGSYEEGAVYSDGKKEDTPHGDHDPVSEKDKKAKDKDRRFYPYGGLGELRSDDKEPGDYRPYYVRAPRHRYHHHHHHHDHHDHHHDHDHDHDHHDRRFHGLKTRQSKSDGDRSHLSADNVHPRSPHHGHYLHQDKVIVSGDGDHVHVHRSVSIAGEQGQSYVVPRIANRNVVQGPYNVPSLRRRDNSDGVPGYINIMSPVAGSGNGERIASLVLASSNTTMADNSSTPFAFVLNASETNETQINLVPSTSNSTNSTLSSNEMLVALSLAMFDRDSASTVPYCATFDPDPAAPVPLTVQKCADGQADEHSSQLFAYNSDTGVVRPMWSQGKDDMESKECTEDVDPSTPQSASLASVTDMDDSEMGADRASMNNFSDLAAESAQAAPADSSAGETPSAQNVALVFVAAEPVVQDTPVTSTTAGSVQATATTASSTATGSSATTSSSMPLPSAQSGAAKSGAAVSTPAPGLPSSSTPPIPRPTPTVLGVQVVAKTESNSTSVNASPTPAMTPVNSLVAKRESNSTSVSASPTPAMKPVNTRPYKWMFKLDSTQK